MSLHEGELSQVDIDQTGNFPSDLKSFIESKLREMLEGLSRFAKIYANLSISKRK